MDLSDTVSTLTSRSAWTNWSVRYDRHMKSTKDTYRQLAEHRNWPRHAVLNGCRTSWFPTGSAECYFRHTVPLMTNFQLRWNAAGGQINHSLPLAARGDMWQMKWKRVPLFTGSNTWKRPSGSNSESDPDCDAINFWSGLFKDAPSFIHTWLRHDYNASRR